MPRPRGFTQKRRKNEHGQAVEATASGQAEAEEHEAAEPGAPLAAALPAEGRDEAAALDSPGQQQLKEAEQFFDTATETLKTKRKLLQYCKKQHKLAHKLFDAKRDYSEGQGHISTGEPFIASVS